MSSHNNIVIIGGGIIGCTTAYYLTHHPSYSPHSTTLTLLEPSVRGVAQGASGKAGGLVAKWAEPNVLAEISFSEHVRLAKELGGEEKWGWRYVQCASWEGRSEAIDVGEGGEYEEGVKKKKRTRMKKGKGGKLPDDLTWINSELTDEYEVLAPHGDTAQVHPYLFTSTMLDLALSKGLRVIQGRATSIHHDNGAVTGVSYTSTSAGGGSTTTTTTTATTLPATHVILATGAWSPIFLPTLPISGARVHSITIHPEVDSTITPHVLFTSIALSGTRTSVTPEIYPRPGPAKEVYVCGAPDSSPLPPTVDDVEVEEAMCARIHEYVGSISSELKEGKVMVRQACYMPMMSTGSGPIVGEADRIAKGLIVAAGHSCWVRKFFYFLN